MTISLESRNNEKSLFATTRSKPTQHLKMFPPVLSTSECKVKRKKRGHETIKTSDCICTYTCLCELSDWRTQTPALLAQVQSAAAPSLEKAAVKVAALRPLVGRGQTEPYTPPAVCQYSRGQWKTCSWTQHTPMCAHNQQGLTVMVRVMCDNIVKQWYHEDSLLMRSGPLVHPTNQKQAHSLINYFVCVCVIRAHFTAVAWHLYSWRYSQLRD